MFSFLFYHKISWKQFLQKLRLFVLYCFNDVLVITGEVEERSTGPGVWQLNQWLIAQRILSAEQSKIVRNKTNRKENSAIDSAGSHQPLRLSYVR